MPVLETDFDLGDIGGIDIDPSGDISPPLDTPQPGDHPPQIEPMDRSVRFIIRTICGPRSRARSPPHHPVFAWCWDRS